jgi:2-dehydro-3-deoxyphosphooctonate aldolase (KDO 8-P synthase)
MNDVPVKDFVIGAGQPLAVMSGPCVIESLDHALAAAEELVRIFGGVGEINFIYKSSYDKANRSSYASFRGPGLQEGLKILERIKKEFNIPVLTDVHSPEEAAAAGQVCDILQIPAFLCRQTDLIVAAGRTGAVINVKKGQFKSSQRSPARPLQPAATVCSSSPTQTPRWQKVIKTPCTRLPNSRNC